MSTVGAARAGKAIDKRIAAHASQNTRIQIGLSPFTVATIWSNAPQTSTKIAVLTHYTFLLGCKAGSFPFELRRSIHVFTRYVCDTILNNPNIMKFEFPPIVTQLHR
jgi:hypothetical protein